MHRLPFTFAQHLSLTLWQLTRATDECSSHPESYAILKLDKSKSKEERQRVFLGPPSWELRLIFALTRKTKDVKEASSLAKLVLGKARRKTVVQSRLLL
jgi:hypothetical protein